METTSCLLCRTASSQLVYQVPDQLLGLPGLFSLVRCDSCGLVYQNPRPSPAEIGNYYPPEYDPFATTPWANKNPITRTMQIHGLRKRWGLVERWAPRREGQRTLLDVGCGPGLFLYAGSERWKRMGVELTEHAARFAREKFGLDVRVGTIEEVDLPLHSFDVITLWDVLEHVYDPVATLQRIRELLKPDGIVVFRVPNLDAWDARLAGRYWAGLDQPRHIFVPDELSVSQIVATAGFREIERQCLSGTYGVLVLSWRFWLTQRVRDPQRRRTLLRLFDNLLVRMALSPLLWITDKIFKKGSLLTVVAAPLD